MANPEKQTSDPHGGLSASGTTADEMHPGQPGPGTTYGDPGGTGTAQEETTGEHEEPGTEGTDQEPAS